LFVEQLENRLLLDNGFPAFIKAFAPDTIGPGSTTSLVFTIDNSDYPEPVDDLSFTDNLPVGVTIAAPAMASTTCDEGTVSAPDGGSTITLSGARLGAFQSCSITVDVTSSTTGVHTNTTGDLTSSAGNSGTATDDLTVDANLPGFSKSFAPDSIPLGGRSTLTFTIDNSANAAAVANLDFTDNLPTGMAIADPANAATDCVSAGLPDTTLTATPGTNVITLDANGAAIGGYQVLPAGATCTVTTDVVATGAGMLDNVSGDLLADFVSSGKASDTLDVTVTPIALTKSFTDDPVPPGGAVTLEFTIDNFDRSDSATSISFTDDLNATLAGLTFDSLLLNDCGGSVSGVGTTDITLSGGTLGPEGSCTIRTSLAVPPGATPGAYTNTTGAITADVDGSPVMGNQASDVLFAEPVPVLTKEFLESGTLNPDPVINAGDDVVIRFTVSNTSQTSMATDITFLDELTDGGPNTGFLPFPVTVTLPPVPDPPCGGQSSLALVSVGFNGQGLELTGGTLAAAGSAGDSCTFDVTLTIPETFPPGIYTNITEEITAIVDDFPVTGPPASDDLTIIAAPALTKSFIDDPVAPGGTATLEFTLEYPADASGDATGIAFTDDLNAALSGLAATGLPANDICGGGSQLTGTTNLSFTGGTLTPGGSCTFSVPVDVPAGAAAGSHANATSEVSATVQGLMTTSSAASDDLDVAGLFFTKEFIDDPVIAGDTTTLRFTIDNVHPTDDATITFFTDNLAADLPGLAATGPPSVDDCGGSLSGTTFLTYTGGSVTSGQSCTIDVEVLVPPGAADGTYANVTSNLSANQGGTVSIDPATDTLTVNSNLLQLTKEFTDDPVQASGTATLEFTLTNLDAGEAASGIAFTDDLNSALLGLAATDLPKSVCGGTVDAIPDTGTVDFSGGSLGAGGSCQFDVSVLVPSGASPAAYTNTTSGVTGTIGGLAVTGDPANDTLVVSPPLTLVKSFTNDPVLPGGTVDLEFTIAYGGDDGSATDIAFTDDLDTTLSGLVATGLPANDVCGTGSQLSGTSTLSFTGGTVDAQSSCTFTVTLDVPLDAPESTVLRNVTSEITAMAGGMKIGGGAAEDGLALSCSTTVRNTDDSGTQSLRSAIACSNVTPGVQTIDFDIPGAGPHTISPLSPLPSVMDPAIIDGTTEPDFAGSPVVQLDGSSAGTGLSVNGLTITAGGAGSTVRGLAINRFDRDGIQIDGGGNNTIEGNRIGTDLTGALDQGNGFYGVSIFNSVANQIGGAEAGNTISGNGRYGVLITTAGSTGNVVEGNRIGTDAAGNGAVPNAFHGVLIQGGAAGNTIGGTASGAGNLISGNGIFGVKIHGPATTGNVVQGNRIGTDEAGNGALPNGRDGVEITGEANSNTIGGTAAGAENVISGNARYGVIINRAGTSGNVVEGNLIGTNAAGNGALPNALHGVVINGGATGNTIGGTADEAGNVISGNDRVGVVISNPTATGNVVQGNLIGTDVAGSEALPNNTHGVLITGSANSNTIGGTADGAGNVISGNSLNGVKIVGVGTTANLVQGNLIGTDSAGNAPLANGRDGVEISTDATSNTIGGTADGAGNVISGNGRYGVVINTPAATGNKIEGNLIGTNAAGAGALGNGQHGVVTSLGANSNTIGGTATGAGNVISGNSNHGVFLGSDNNMVYGNLIGTDVSGGSALGNAGSGVVVTRNDNQIGAPLAGADNVVAYNGIRGVVIASGTGNAIRQNSIHDNGGATRLGIDLNNDGVTANDAGDPDAGPNNLQNFPVIESVILNGGNLDVTYLVDSTTANSAYDLTVEFFIADSNGQEGETFLGQTNYPAAVAGGSAFGVVPAGPAGVGTSIVATATDDNGNTSEFSAPSVVSPMLQAAGGELSRASGVDGQELEANDLFPIVDAAIDRLVRAGLAAETFSNVHVSVADLPGATLGLAAGNVITIDVDAAGYGWFIDATPQDDSEFSASSLQPPASSLGIDLLTAVMHELGHTAGLEDIYDIESEDDLMYAWLEAGERRTPNEADVDRLFALFD